MIQVWHPLSFSAKFIISTVFFLNASLSDLVSYKNDTHIPHSKKFQASTYPTKIVIYILKYFDLMYFCRFVLYDMIWRMMQWRNMGSIEQKREIVDTLSKSFFSIPHFNSGIDHFILLKWGINFRNWIPNARIEHFILLKWGIHFQNWESMPAVNSWLYK